MKESKENFSFFFFRGGGGGGGGRGAKMAHLAKPKNVSVDSKCEQNDNGR